MYKACRISVSKRVLLHKPIQIHRPASVQDRIALRKLQHRRRVSRPLIPLPRLGVEPEALEPAAAVGEVAAVGVDRERRAIWIGTGIRIISAAVEDDPLAVRRVGVPLDHLALIRHQSCHIEIGVKRRPEPVVARAVGVRAMVDPAGRAANAKGLGSRSFTESQALISNH
jgi:hypothetical protein